MEINTTGPAWSTGLVLEPSVIWPWGLAVRIVITPCVCIAEAAMALIAEAAMALTSQGFAGMVLASFILAYGHGTHMHTYI